MHPCELQHDRLFFESHTAGRSKSDFAKSITLAPSISSNLWLKYWIRPSPFYYIFFNPSGVMTPHFFGDIHQLVWHTNVHAVATDAFSWRSH